MQIDTEKEFGINLVSLSLSTNIEQRDNLQGFYKQVKKIEVTYLWQQKPKRRDTSHGFQSEESINHLHGHCYILQAYQNEKTIS